MSVPRHTLTFAASLITGLFPHLALTQTAPPAPNLTVVGVSILTPPPTFYIQSYLGKCLDFGASDTGGTQVYVSACNNSAEQQVTVQEVDAQHDVILHAGNKVLGYRPPVIGAAPGAEVAHAYPSASAPPVYALELQEQAPANPIEVSSITLANQIFALDGDSIILASDRTLSVQVQNGLGANGSPLVVTTRTLADSEFWNFNQIGGFDIDPTSGFVRAGYPGSAATGYDTLLSRIPPYHGNLCQGASPACQPSLATPGTVIQIYPGTEINLTGLEPLQIPSGVTIRGSRRGTLFGPLLYQQTTKNESSMLEVPEGDSDVRISGLRLQGNSQSTSEGQQGSRGVLVDPLTVRTIVDHNDISAFTLAGVEVNGTQTDLQLPCAAGDSADPQNRPYDAFIARNFFHHNEMQNDGYAVGIGYGAFPLVLGNMFYLNRHAIAADGWTRSGYRAWYNLVLSDSPLQLGFADWPFHTQDFDMHGTGSDGFDGYGGDYVQINSNTFLGTNRPNYEIRGIPCNESDFNANVSLESSGSAVDVKLSNDDSAVAVPPGTLFFETNGNYFDSSNPTNNLGVGDFDGDGIQDLFLATGTAWYFAPQGSAEWRFLSAKTAPIGSLIFGDFDGDGRTDVATLQGNTLMVSWGGVSDWEYLNTVNASITDLAVGKFGNHAANDPRDDIFWSNGTSWYVSSDGTGPFTLTATSSAHGTSLRFGDFNGDGITDVLSIIAGKWMVSYNATSDWTPLPKSLTNTMDGVVVADFDGDGRADIAYSTAIPIEFNGVPIVFWTWQFSSAGATDWTYRTPQSGTAWGAPISASAAIGNFDGNKGADVLIWGDDEHLYIVSGGSLQGSVAVPMYSRQDLR